MKPLRLALIRQRYTPFGGAERFVARAMDALATEGATLTLVTRKWEGSGNFISCNPFYLGSLWRDWGFARCACRKLGQARFDLVQSHERVACCDIYRAGDGVHREWLAQRGRTSGFFTRLATALNPYHRYVLAAEKRLFESPQLKAVICNSKMVKDEILRHFAIPESRLKVIYSGVDVEHFHPRLTEQHRAVIRSQLSVPDEAIAFLFVGSGFYRKGLAATLQALAQLPANAHLLVVGQDRKAAHYKRMAQTLNIGQRVHFLGPQRDVTPYYGAVDAAVLPTLYDPFPNVALEAMACGLPFITSTSCGAAELIRPGENGFACDALDTNTLAQSMRQLLTPGRAKTMGAQARQTVGPMTLSAMSENLLALYRSVLGRSTQDA